MYQDLSRCFHEPRMTARNAGVLMHPTSLPGRFGIGDLGDELIAFLDWAGTAGMQIWQLLPLNPPGYGNSPYGCHSSYAGNPLVISPDRLVSDGLLPAEALSGIPKFPDDRVDFDRVVEFKNDLLRQSWDHFNKHAREDHRYAQRRFEEDNKWLDDWAAYAALKKRHNEARWTEWPRAVAMREPATLSATKRELAAEISYHKYIQFLFFRQWAAIREAADARKILIMGDVPTRAKSKSSATSPFTSQATAPMSGPIAICFNSTRTVSRPSWPAFRPIISAKPDSVGEIRCIDGMSCASGDIDGGSRVFAPRCGSPTSSASIISGDSRRIGRFRPARRRRFTAAGCRGQVE